MIDGLAIVTVIGGTWLPALHEDRKAVDVDRHPPRGMVATGRPQMTLTRLAQHVAQRRPIAGRERHNVDQPRRTGLTGQTLCQRLLAGPISHRHLHGRTMGQVIGIILSRVLLRQRIQSLAERS